MSSALSAAVLTAYLRLPRQREHHQDNCKLHLNSDRLLEKLKLHFRQLVSHSLLLLSFPSLVFLAQPLLTFKVCVECAIHEASRTFWCMSVCGLLTKCATRRLASKCSQKLSGARPRSNVAPCSPPCSARIQAFCSRIKKIGGSRRVALETFGSWCFARRWDSRIWQRCHLRRQNVGLLFRVNGLVFATTRFCSVSCYLQFSLRTASTRMAGIV